MSWAPFLLTHIPTTVAPNPHATNHQDTRQTVVSRAAGRCRSVAPQPSPGDVARDCRGGGKGSPTTALLTAGLLLGVIVFLGSRGRWRRDLVEKDSIRVSEVRGVLHHRGSPAPLPASTLRGIWWRTAPPAPASPHNFPHDRNAAHIRSPAFHRPRVHGDDHVRPPHVASSTARTCRSGLGETGVGAGVGDTGRREAERADGGDIARCEVGSDFSLTRMGRLCGVGRTGGVRCTVHGYLRRSWHRIGQGTATAKV